MVEKHVVIADGNKASAMSLVKILESNGYIIDSIQTDGIDASSVCIARKTDIVFLKTDLDFMSGFATSSLLRNKGFEGTIIIISDDYSSEISVKVLENGADGCVVEPITEKFLIPWLETMRNRTGEIKKLTKEKESLLQKLESKRILEEASGIIAASAGVSLIEANNILNAKAKAGKMTTEEIAKMVVNSSKENK